MSQSSNTRTSNQQPDRPWPFRLINWAGTKVNLNRLPWVDLSENSLLEAAQQITGLYDWGEESFRTPFRIFLESLNKEAELNLVGRYLFRQDCIRLLANRLQLQHDFKRYPEILQVPIRRPLIVVGMFRSGTTFLHNLLSCDRSSRWLHLAEALIPSPPPQKETWSTDPRVQQAENLVKFQNSLSPNFATAHYIDARIPAECSRLFEHKFIGHLFDFRANVKTYSNWLQQQDLVDSYRYYRQQLQYLEWRWPGSHWVLKAPAHIFSLDALLAVFPDACIVYNHRDPLKVLPSCCSLAAMGRKRFTDRVDFAEVGTHWLNVLAQGTDRAMQVRSEAAAERFYDVNYTDLIKDPIKTVRQIYEYFGYHFDDEIAENIKKWIQDNPQHKRGVHRYTLEQFGLDATEVSRRFTDYYERFNVTREK